MLQGDLPMLSIEELFCIVDDFCQVFLTYLSLTDDFNDFPEETLANFFWLQSGLLTELSELFRALVKQ